MTGAPTMAISPRSAAWFRLAAVYFALGVGLGIVMGATRDHSLHAVHAHLNLLGWASMALFGLVAALFPDTARGRAADWHFRLYNAGLPVMLAALAARLRGVEAAEPVVGVASLVVGAAVLLFVVSVFTGLPRATRAGGAVSGVRVR